jgi:hypothetical protein
VKVLEYEAGKDVTLALPLKLRYAGNRAKTPNAGKTASDKAAQIMWSAKRLSASAESIQIREFMVPGYGVAAAPPRVTDRISPSPASSLEGPTQKSEPAAE